MPSTPIPFRPLTADDLDPKKDPTLGYLNEVIRAITNQTNLSSGALGPIPIQGNLNLNGNRIMNVGPAVDPDDVLTTTSATPVYGVKVQQATMEAVGKNMLQTTRRLNDGQQQHRISSDLNTQGNIPPTNIQGTLSWISTTIKVTWTWSGIVIQYADLSYVGVKDGSLVVTGLQNLTYLWYPYYDARTGLLTFVADSVNGSGAPPSAFKTSLSAAIQTTEAQAQTGDTRIPLTPGAQTVAPSSSGNAALKTR